MFKKKPQEIVSKKDFDCLDKRLTYQELKNAEGLMLIELASEAMEQHFIRRYRNCYSPQEQNEEDTRALDKEMVIGYLAGRKIIIK